MRNKITAMEQRVKKKIEFRYMENVILNQNEKFKQLMKHIQTNLQGSKSPEVKNLMKSLQSFEFKEVHTDHK